MQMLGEVRHPWRRAGGAVGRDNIISQRPVWGGTGRSGPAVQGWPPSAAIDGHASARPSIAVETAPSIAQDHTPARIGPGSGRFPGWDSRDVFCALSEIGAGRAWYLWLDPPRTAHRRHRLTQRISLPDHFASHCQVTCARQPNAGEKTGREWGHRGLQLAGPLLNSLSRRGFGNATCGPPGVMSSYTAACRVRHRSRSSVLTAL